MKRFFSILLLLLFCLGTIPALSADVMWEPEYNNFYKKHFSECISHQKYYLVMTDTLTGQESPEDEQVRHLFHKGDELYVGMTYTDGKGQKWAAVDYQDDGWHSCWLKFDALYPVFDTKDFLLDHADEILTYSGPAEDLSFTKELILWPYPGADTVWCTTYPDLPINTLDYPSRYVDQNGKEWLYLPYYLSFDGWLYLDDPYSTEPHLLSGIPPHTTLEPDVSPEPSPTLTPEPDSAYDPAATPGEPVSDEPAADQTEPNTDSSLISAQEGSHSPLLTVVIVGVAAVMAITLALILIFFRKK